MTIRQLEYFCAVAEGRSISAAARALHVAQPPISRQIAQLEAELGVQLFARESRGMKLTEAGQTLYRQSRSLFLNLRRVEENVRSIGAGEGGRINVGVIYSAMPYALHYLEAYHARYPKVEFYIRLGSPQGLLNDLRPRRAARPLSPPLHAGVRQPARAHPRRGRAGAHHDRRDRPRAGAGRRAHRAAARRADVPAALG